MKTPQEKIDEIHSILVKWESRRKWNAIFSWVYRAIILGFVILILFFPSVILDATMIIMKPIIQDITNQIIQTQKENISNFWQNLSEKALDLYQNNFPTR